MNKAEIIKIIFLHVITLTCISVYAADADFWIDHTNNTQLTLSNGGQFQFSNASSNIQGSYSAQNNILMMQDTAGNYYQYNIVSYTTEEMILSDQNGVNYSYVRNNQGNNPDKSMRVNINFPWEKQQYNTVLSSSQGYQWRERENQIYIEFLQFLIGQSITHEEVTAIRTDFTKQFNQRPEAFVNEVKGIEETMRKVYSLNNMQDVALVREEISTAFYNLLKQQPQMRDYAFVQTLNRYVQILSFDNQSNLSLSNQDVDGYINYIQFQSMLMGQDYKLSQEDRLTLQYWLINEFNNYPVEQKQTLAFAGFIWNNLVMQWTSMNAGQQQQYIMQVQSQMNIQNVAVNEQTATNFWSDSNNYSSSYPSFNSSNDYTAQAEANYAQRMRETDNMIFTAIQNNMTENHVTMMNMFNTDSDYEYVVDYGNNY